MIMHPTAIPSMTDMTLRINTGLRRSEGVEKKNREIRTGTREAEPLVTMRREVNEYLRAVRGSISCPGIEEKLCGSAPREDII